MLYDRGEIPCRIVFDLNKLNLKWDEPASPKSTYPLMQALPFDFIKIFFEGLSETKHPLNTISRLAIFEFLDLPVF